MSIKSRLEHTLSQIRETALAAGRTPASITCLAVSKTRSPEEIRECYQLGQRHFGENYVQEAIKKITVLKDLDIIWHFIGPIQANKTALLAQHFSWVHSIDRLKIAERLSRERPAGLPPLNICVQVNISGEASKSGVSPSECESLVHAIQSLPHLSCRGLMAIPAPTLDRDLQHRHFQTLKTLLDQCNSHLNAPLDTLSMGMSDDYLAAIEEGATIVRIGTAIFGARR